MKSLYELCQPRADVFEDKHQDDVLDLANLTEDSIDADLFFEETYFTDGMKQLVDLAFQRFAGIGATGLIRLKQAMGGGKTHNMITLGLLAKHPELREKYAKNLTHDVQHPIKVISFTGRNNDVPFGIWGEIAAQLGKKEMFSDYYIPLAAPGQNSWIRLLKDEPMGCRYLSTKRQRLIQIHSIRLLELDGISQYHFSIILTSIRHISHCHMRS